jgi:hypothetical protein
VSGAIRYQAVPRVEFTTGTIRWMIPSKPPRTFADCSLSKLQ